jgi:uncharacterized protein
MTPQIEPPTTINDIDMTEPAPGVPDTATRPPPPTPDIDWAGAGQWQPLPPRAQRVFLYVALLIAVPPTFVASATVYDNLPQHGWGWLAIAAVWLVSLSVAFWFARKRYRYTFWKLDADGFAVRRGRLWQWETRVPTSRVQHLDLKRGPLERSHRLASLVLHTAGTRLSAVSISGLDDADAERLRDHFSRQIDRQEDDDHAA